MREYQVRICEMLGVKFPGPTRQKRRFWMSANRSALLPKTDVTLALSDLRQRRANLAVNLRKVVRRQMRQPYRAARAARPYVYASGPAPKSAPSANAPAPILPAKT